MEDKSKQDEIISSFKNENYDEEVIALVKDDLEAGLSEDQVSIYKVRRLKSKERQLISKGMRLGIPSEVISDMVNHKYKEAQYTAVIDEYESGTDISVIKDVMSEFRTGHDITETFRQVKERMADTKEKPAEPETTEDKTEDAVSENLPSEGGGSSSTGGVISSKDFLDSVRLMMDTFSNTMQMQFDHMNKRDDEYRQAHDSETEKILNDKISSLESALEDSRKDLSAASSVVSEKEQMIKSMQSDIDSRTKELSAKDDEIKKLREEMEQMKAGNIPMNGSGSSAMAGGTQGNQNIQYAFAGNNSPKNTQSTAESRVQGAGHTPNYTMNLTTANGNQIPLQVERTERKSQSGLSALMSKFLPKGPAKTLLTRMIEGRYSGEQMTEIIYAYEKHLNEDEVQELLDANLPADEMHGIINVVAAAKGGEE